MATLRIAALAGILALATIVAAALSADGAPEAAATQTPPAGVCAPHTTVSALATNLVHCQCGPATCVVSDHVTGQAKTYGLQCVR